MQRSRCGDVAAALGLVRGPALVAIVGGGGKSSLMFALGACLPGRVVLTTTTRIFAAQMQLAATVAALGDSDWRRRLAVGPGPSLLVGAVAGERALGVPPELPARLLADGVADWVVVEADGSRMRPVKAPAEHEPVLPESTDLLVVVAGIDALDGPIREVAHRPERVAAVTGLPPERSLGPAALGQLLASPQGGAKHAERAARFAVLLNKVESETQRRAARGAAESALASAAVERVVIGALRPTGGGGRTDRDVLSTGREVLSTGREVSSMDREVSRADWEVWRAE